MLMCEQMAAFYRTVVLRLSRDRKNSGAQPWHVRYTLETKIKALNLLEEHDGDTQLVKDRLDIPVKTLANWRRAELELRQRFYDRQQHHFYNVKFKLLGDMLGGCAAIMGRINEAAIEEASLSQRSNALNTLLNNAVKLEEAFEALEEKNQQDQEPNSTQFSDDDNAPEAPPRPTGKS